MHFYLFRGLWGFSTRFQALSPSLGQLLTCYSPVRRYTEGSSRRLAIGTARLACVKRAASVRPEPGSNSPFNPRLRLAEKAGLTPK